MEAIQNKHFIAFRWQEKTGKRFEIYTLNKSGVYQLTMHGKPFEVRIQENAILYGEKTDSGVINLRIGKKTEGVSPVWEHKKLIGKELSQILKKRLKIDEKKKEIYLSGSKKSFTEIGNLFRSYIQYDKIKPKKDYNQLRKDNN